MSQCHIHVLLQTRLVWWLDLSVKVEEINTMQTSCSNWCACRSQVVRWWNTKIRIIRCINLIRHRGCVHCCPEQRILTMHNGFNCCADASHTISVGNVWHVSSVHGQSAYMVGHYRRIGEHELRKALKVQGDACVSWLCESLTEAATKVAKVYSIYFTLRCFVHLAILIDSSDMKIYNPILILQLYAIGNASPPWACAIWGWLTRRQRKARSSGDLPGLRWTGGNCVERITTLQYKEENRLITTRLRTVALLFTQFILPKRCVCIYYARVLKTG